MLFALLAHYSQRWDAAAWRVLIQRVLKHMLALPPHLGTSSVSAAADAAGRSRGSSSFSGFTPSQTATGAAAAGGGRGAGAAVPAGMSAAEQSLLMTTLLQRMDRYYPLLCEQAGVIRPEYQVGA